MGLLFLGIIPPLPPYLNGQRTCLLSIEVERSNRSGGAISCNTLFPLDYNEALSALLKVKPGKSKEEMDKAIKKDEKKKKKPD